MARIYDSQELLERDKDRLANMLQDVSAQRRVIARRKREIARVKKLCLKKN